MQTGRWDVCSRLDEERARSTTHHMSSSPCDLAWRPRARDLVARAAAHTTACSRAWRPYISLFKAILNSLVGFDCKNVFISYYLYKLISLSPICYRDIPLRRQLHIAGREHHTNAQKFCLATLYFLSQKRIAEKGTNSYLCLSVTVIKYNIIFQDKHYIYFYPGLYLLLIVSYLISLGVCCK